MTRAEEEGGAEAMSEPDINTVEPTQAETELAESLIGNTGGDLYRERNVMVIARALAYTRIRAEEAARIAWEMNSNHLMAERNWLKAEEVRLREEVARLKAKYEQGAK